MRRTRRRAERKTVKGKRARGKVENGDTKEESESEEMHTVSGGDAGGEGREMLEDMENSGGLGIVLHPPPPSTPTSSTPPEPRPAIYITWRHLVRLVQLSPSSHPGVLS